MITPFNNKEEVALLAAALYESTIRSQVETPDNIGKMVVIDTETGKFAVDSLGFDAANSLRQYNPKAHLFAIRIGYNVAASLGGDMRRTTNLYL